MELTDAMLEGSAEEIMQRVLELARNGDKAILVKCFERLVPRPRERPVSIQMPPVNSAADRANAVQAIIAQAAAGEIALSEAERFVRLIDIQIEAIETSEHARVADELLQSRGSGIARLAPESDGALVGDNRAPATEINGESAADPVAPEAGTGASASNGASPGDERRSSEKGG